MSKPILFSILFSLLSTAAAQSALTEAESRWLHAGAPVIAYARQAGLPLDIIVQPQAAPGAVPLALGFDGGRCKLVLSMRGNPQAEELLEPVPLAQREWMIEAMTAHEIGHCWRYAQGDWHAVPSGLMEAPLGFARRPDLRKAAQDIRDTRREEGFADLVALAWIGRRHPAQYGQVHAWLESVRASGAQPGNSHDTLVWLRLASEADAFGVDKPPFEQAQALWSKGLIGDK